MLPIGGNLSKKKVMDEIRLDYFLHALVYFAICLYFLFGIIKNTPLFRDRAVIKFLGIIVFLAVVTEVVQLVAPYRSFSWVDLSSDFVGIVLGMGMVILTTKNFFNH
jgi:VanZ family protein